MINDRQFMFDPEMDIEDIDLDDNEFDNLMFGNNVKVLLQDMDLIKWRQDLEEDREKLVDILAEARRITADRDEKLLTLKALIRQKIDSVQLDKLRKAKKALFKLVKMKSFLDGDDEDLPF